MIEDVQVDILRAYEKPALLLRQVGGEARVKAWLDSGGDPDTQDSGGLGETLLFYAAAAGDCDTINLLMSRGASVDWRGYNGRTSLTTAVFGDFRRAALCLLIDAHGANVNARDDTGRTPLHEAAQQDATEAVLVLLRRGATYGLCDNEGRDAETEAKEAWRGTWLLLVDVRLAGGFKKYIRQPIIDLNVLRLLCERGRATAPSGFLTRLFAGHRTFEEQSTDAPDPAPSAVLSRELFACVLSFWRSSRALDEDRADDGPRMYVLYSAARDAHDARVAARRPWVAS